MGYAKADQRGKGLHLRQFSRAFIFDDGTERITYVSTDAGMMGHGVKMEVKFIYFIRKLSLHLRLHKNLLQPIFQFYLLITDFILEASCAYVFRCEYFSNIKVEHKFYFHSK